MHGMFDLWGVTLSLGSINDDHSICKVVHISEVAFLLPEQNFIIVIAFMMLKMFWANILICTKLLKEFVNFVWPKVVTFF